MPLEENIGGEPEKSGSEDERDTSESVAIAWVTEQGRERDADTGNSQYDREGDPHSHGMRIGIPGSVPKPRRARRA